MKNVLRRMHFGRVQKITYTIKEIDLLNSVWEACQNDVAELPEHSDTWNVEEWDEEHRTVTVVREIYWEEE